MSIFVAEGEGRWQPTPFAAGPFAGLQGGAVAGLLTGEIEAAAAERGWGAAVSAAAWFLRPVPLAPLRTEINVLRQGGRVSVVDNTLWADGAEEPCATARVTLMREREVMLPSYQCEDALRADPTVYPQASRQAPHGGPWFMDAMEARPGADVAWFRMKEPIVEGAGPLTAVLGPADWTHGISRPVHNALADPNPNLTVHLVRAPRGPWIGIRPVTHWDPARGIGIGRGALLDSWGEIGAVSMAVALTPFPTLAKAET